MEPRTTLATALRAHCDETGESMRALSLRAGQSERCVSQIMRIPGLRPRRTTLEALSAATGIDLSDIEAGPAITYRGLMDRLEAADPGTPDRRKASRLRWLMRHTGWVPEIQVVCIREVAEWFATRTAASVDLKPGSFATYKTQVLDVVGGTARHSRPRGVADLRPAHRAIWNAIKDDGGLVDWQLFTLSPLIAWLDARGMEPAEITTDVLADYYAHRLEVCGKSETSTRKRVIEIAGILGRLAEVEDLDHLGLRRVDHPFGDGRDRFGVQPDAIAALMSEVDASVLPWARGEASSGGMSRMTFLQMLDEEATIVRGPLRDKKARLKMKRDRTRGPGPRDAGDDQLRHHGFLTSSERWSEKTAATKRGQVVSLAKALLAAHDTPIECVEELTDPDYLEPALEALAEANAGGEPSSYVSSVLKTVRKIAVGYARRPAADIKRIDDLRSEFAVRWTGLAPRIRKRLRQFDDRRIQTTVDLGTIIITGMNKEIDRRRKAHRKKHGVLPERIAVVDASLAQDMMTAIAHGILMTRAPRSANVVEIELGWIAWRGEVARITVPAERVKARKPGESNLVIDLNHETSRLLRTYLDRVRGKALQAGDEDNLHLFPAQGTGNDLGQPYRGLLRRVCRRVETEAGATMNPHLFRHLLGLIWLRDDPRCVAQVQRLLGHKSLATTMEYYVEFQEEEVQAEWHRLMEKLTATASNTPLHKMRAP